MDSTIDSKPGAWLQKTGIMLSACLVGLVLVELAMRVLGLSFPVFDTYDPMRGTKLVPGKEGWYRKEGEAYIEINSLGYRDIEHELAKPAGTFRIAVLGDSFTEARQMPIEDTYWHRLGPLLDECPALVEHNIEVLNFGIGGYGTTQEILTYDLDARRFQPDLVLLGFFPGNDLRENSKTLSTKTKRASWLISIPFYSLVDGELELEPPASPPAWKRWLYVGIQHSRLLELVNEVRRQWGVKKKRENQERRIQQVEIGIAANVYQPPEDPDVAEAWTLASRLLAELDDKVRADGAKLMVATIPASAQTHPDLTYRDGLVDRLGVDDLLFPERQLAKFGQEGGYPVFPLVEEMQQAAGDRHFHGFENSGFGHGHMNAAGHQAMAQLLAPKICAALDG